MFEIWLVSIKITYKWEFPGGLVVEDLALSLWCGFNLCPRKPPYLPRAEDMAKKKKKKKKKDLQIKLYTEFQGFSMKIRT